MSGLNSTAVFFLIFEEFMLCSCRPLTIPVKKMLMNPCVKHLIGIVKIMQDKT